jgi:hypothetical protein
MRRIALIVIALAFAPLVLGFMLWDAAREARLKRELGADYEGPAAGWEDES